MLKSIKEHRKRLVDLRQIYNRVMYYREIDVLFRKGNVLLSEWYVPHHNEEVRRWNSIKYWWLPSLSEM